MRFSDPMLAGILFVFAALLAAYAVTLPPLPGQRFGAELFPQLIALGFAGCSLALFLQWLARARRDPSIRRQALVTRTKDTLGFRALSAILITIVLVIFYILFSEDIGFLPLMAGLLIILFRLLQVPWRTTALGTVAGTVTLDLVFRSLLLVPLPYGIMPYLPW